MLDKLNGILVRDTVIELLKSYLAGCPLHYCPQKQNSTWLLRLPEHFFSFFFFAWKCVRVCEGLPLPHDTV